MPTIKGVTNIAAGGNNPNVLAGSAFEFVGFPARVNIGIVGDAGGFLRATVQSGSDVLMEESPVSRAARVPVWPDDYDLEDVAAAGDRLKIAIRNTGVAALDVFWAIKVTPLVG
jgi:hypothetical protein